MYSPVLVSTLITSPSLTNIGTLTIAPVSSVAGFIALVAVFPLTPGSDCVINNSTKFGASTENASPLKNLLLQTYFLLRILLHLQLFHSLKEFAHMFLDP